VATSAHDLCRYGNTSSGRYSYVYVAIGTDAPCGAGLCKGLRIVRRNFPGGSLRGQVRYDLKETGHKPILQNGSVRFRRLHIDGKQMRFTIGQKRYEGCQVQEVGGKIESPVGCYRSPRWGKDAASKDNRIRKGYTCDLVVHQ